MDTTLLKRLATRVFPEGVLLAAAAVVGHVHALHTTVAGFTGFYASAVLVVGTAVALRFGRSRLLFSILVLTLAVRFLPRLPPGDVSAEHATFQAIGVLLPLNLAMIAILPERGLLTFSGILRLAAILGQGAIAGAFVSAAPGLTARVLEEPILPAALRFLTAWTPLGGVGLVVFILSAVALIAAQRFESGAGARPALWALVAAFLALHAEPAGSLPTFYFTTAGLILVVGVVESSFLLAYRDGLTGLPARRALNEALERLDGPYAVAMVDVDHFKRVNDRHGHDTGDQVLKMVAGHLATVSDGGKAFRYGGEEFAILFAGKSVADVVPELERLRESVSHTAFAVRSLTRLRRKPRAEGGGAGGRAKRGTRTFLTVTVSIGVAKDVAAADRALYRAKEGGRDQVCT